MIINGSKAYLLCRLVKEEVVPIAVSLSIDHLFQYNEYTRDTWIRHTGFAGSQEWISADNRWVIRQIGLV
jgi:hypothetical protein